MTENSCNLFVQKYQPIYFKDFEIDEDLVQFFRTLIIMDKINILIVGNVASGKTSLLNAIIKEYYYGLDSQQYQDNVLYINSLKEQGINYYRVDVKTFCQTCSSVPGKKKFVVLDDIDLINEQSQQVFRNYIDKFNHNVNFISSCNNIQKVIESIQSRLMIIKVNPLKNENLKIILKKIKERENISITPEAEEFVISISNNAAKILLSYMEKFKLLNEPITYDLALQLCTNISFITLQDYTLYLKEHKLQDALRLIYDIFDKGYSVMDILDSYFTFVKNTSILNEDEKYEIIPFICKYITYFHTIHEDEVELALFTNNLLQIFV